ncbi:unnamed protein product, partial [Nesidiocoris tenuis]
MVIALEKKTSDPMLTLAALKPLYLSPNTRSGTQEIERWFPPPIEWSAEPDPWEPPPAPPVNYWVDEDENYWIEEERTGEDGEVRLGRRLVRLADGTTVEDGEWKPIPEAEPELPPSQLRPSIQALCHTSKLTRFTFRTNVLVNNKNYEIRSTTTRCRWSIRKCAYSSCTRAMLGDAHYFRCGLPQISKWP